MAILSGMFTCLIPLVTKAAESWIASRKTKSEQDSDNGYLLAEGRRGNLKGAVAEWKKYQEDN